MADSGCYCGDLSWSLTQHGRTTHKQSCPARTEPWCQTHPNGCPPDCKPLGARSGACESEVRCLSYGCQGTCRECDVCGLPEGQICADCAEDERERDIERAERLAEEDRFLYGI